MQTNIKQNFVTPEIRINLIISWISCSHGGEYEEYRPSFNTV
jgi:hypothetical protein